MKNTNLDKKYASIPAEMFTPVNKDKVLNDQKFDTKPVGYLTDAWRRFKKNKGAVVASLIILVMVLFAIIAPYCSNYELDEANGRYKHARPKVSFMDGSGTGFWDGTYVKDQPYQDYVNNVGIAIGTMYDEIGDVYNWEDAENSKYNPIKKVLNSYSQTLTLQGKEVVEDRFEYRIDSYHEVGFIKVEGLTEEQYNDILDWEEETGLKVLYPLIDTNNASAYNSSNLNESYQENYWYWHDGNNNPIDKEGNVLTLDQIKNGELVANYRYGYVDAEDGQYICDGTNYYDITEMSAEDIVSKARLTSKYKKDSKGEYAFVDGDYVLASTLSPEEQATNTDRYKLNYVAVDGTNGEYVFDGDQYKKVSDLTAEQLKTAYPRYASTFTLTTDSKEGKYIFYDGKYMDFMEYQSASGLGFGALKEWNKITEKYKADYALSADGEYVKYNNSYTAAKNLTDEARASLVKYYNLEWNMDRKNPAPGTHMYSNGEYVKIVGLSDEEIVDLMPKYNFEMMMYRRTGADGKNLTVRVLYYNYYQYLKDKEPMFTFGADSQGYDIFTRLAYGARLSFILSIVVVILNLAMGIVYGSIQGYYGGKVDMIMMYITDVIGGFSTTVLVTLFKMHFVDTGKISQLTALILAFAALGWIADAHAVRMQFYRFKGQEYVLAARTLGASDFRLIFKHIFPNAIGTLITGWAFVIPGVIGMETFYSYLGIINFNGADMTSIGTMLANGQAAGIDRFPHIVLFPALILGLLMIAFNLFGNGLRDAFNPSLRGSED